MMMPSIFNDNLFHDWMDFSFPEMPRKSYENRMEGIMKTDIREKEDGYEVEIDLPGFKKEDISAELKDGYLTVSAVRDIKKEEKGKDDHYIRRERYTGNMSRRFFVGEQITKEDIHAKFENGILLLDIPKKAEKKQVEEKHFVTIEG